MCCGWALDSLICLVSLHMLFWPWQITLPPESVIDSHDALPPGHGRLEGSNLDKGNKAIKSTWSNRIRPVTMVSYSVNKVWVPERTTYISFNAEQPWKTKSVMFTMGLPVRSLWGKGTQNSYDSKTFIYTRNVKKLNIYTCICDQKGPSISS